MPLALQSPRHGKSRVRVAKVIRDSPRHTFVEYSVEIELFGGSERAFTHGDNSHVVSTDTCKNHVYLLAKTHACDAPETFALDLAQKFLVTYEWLGEARVTVMEKPWRRMVSDEGEHVHGFALGADGTRVATVSVARGDGEEVKAEVLSGLESLSVLKTTQSGWAGYFSDKHTTLPETSERILATTIDAKWTYKCSSLKELRSLPFGEIHAKVRTALVQQFYGPVDVGAFSPGVQNTLFQMASSAVQSVEEVRRVTLSLPNLHFLPCTIPVFAKNGVKFEDDVFIPTDEPHGIISASVEASGLEA